jgi:hypothetical protein
MKTQWPTILINVLAWLEVLRGVLQILVLQNSPPLQSLLLKGQYICPQA